MNNYTAKWGSLHCPTNSKPIYIVLYSFVCYHYIYSGRRYYYITNQNNTIVLIIINSVKLLFLQKYRKI